MNDSMASSSNTLPDSLADLDEELGFGRVASQEWRGRFVNADGRPNGRKLGLGAQRGERLFLHALHAPWTDVIVWLVGGVLLLNGIFALAYRALGDAALVGGDTLGLDDPFLRAFVYSVGVFTTTGTPGLHVVGPTAHFLMVTESLLGPLLAFGMAGLIIARVMRPRAQIRFSESAVVAPYDGGRGLMFRMVNELPGDLSNVRANVFLSWWERTGAVRERNYRRLELELDTVAFFPLHWTVVHPLTPQSPLRGVTPERLAEGQAELLILITAHEETFSTEVSARKSYTWDEVAWDAKFTTIFTTDGTDGLTIDVERLSRLDRLPEGTTRVAPEQEGVPIPS